MKTKLLTILITIAVMFAFVGMASATDHTVCPNELCGCDSIISDNVCVCAIGTCPCNPIEFLYVYADWDGWPFDTYPDLNTAGPQIYTINKAPYYVNVTSLEGYLADTYWAYPSDELVTIAKTNYSAYDIVFYDMVNIFMDATSVQIEIPEESLFYDPNVTTYYDVNFSEAAFVAANNDKLLTAIRTGPNNNTCSMPSEFFIRDTGDYVYYDSQYNPANPPILNTNLSALKQDYTPKTQFIDPAFTTKFFKIHDSPDAGSPKDVFTADTTHCDAMAELLIAKYLGLPLPTFSLNP
ncbi:hypothetical protein MmiAt1_17290 [Methanimicrococcus sp. At1]|uniref:Transglutaminase-like domain-containing protein n=1 Tax=Methanimicrococcus hacksteinii TaxID=3028293 RepID=A0ABU3VRR7_9EURY|nr:hypothetical protein [Methanimicrococcus sp. At1]MDV0446114.1 hypothetical protein [Methanimicrococcus sp. At1]